MKIIKNLVLVLMTSVSLMPLDLHAAAAGRRIAQVMKTVALSRPFCPRVAQRAQSLSAGMSTQAKQEVATVLKKSSRTANIAKRVLKYSLAGTSVGATAFGIYGLLNMTNFKVVVCEEDQNNASIDTMQNDFIVFYQQNSDATDELIKELNENELSDALLQKAIQRIYPNLDLLRENPNNALIASGQMLEIIWFSDASKEATEKFKQKNKILQQLLYDKLQKKFPTSLIIMVIGSIPVAITMSSEDEQVMLTHVVTMKEKTDYDSCLLIVHSDGGGTSSSEKIIQKISSSCKDIPLICCVPTIAGSEGYRIATQSDKIIVSSNPQAVLGHIGVITSTGMESGMTPCKYKIPSEFRYDLDPEDESEELKEVFFAGEVAYKKFVIDVRKNRKKAGVTLAQDPDSWAEGRMFCNTRLGGMHQDGDTIQRAQELGLVDVVCPVDSNHLDIVKQELDKLRAQHADKSARAELATLGELEPIKNKDLIIEMDVVS